MQFGSSDNPYAVNTARMDSGGRSIAQPASLRHFHRCPWLYRVTPMFSNRTRFNHDDDFGDQSPVRQGLEENAPTIGQQQQLAGYYHHRGFRRYEQGQRTIVLFHAPTGHSVMFHYANAVSGKSSLSASMVPKSFMKIWSQFLPPEIPENGDIGWLTTQSIANQSPHQIP